MNFVRLSISTTFLFCCFSLFTLQNIIAQNVEWSVPQKFDKKFPNVNVFAHDDNTLYMYKYGDNLNTIKIDIYDENLNLLDQKVIKLKNKEAEINYVHLWHGQFVVFYTIPNIKVGTLDFYVQKINKNGDFDGEAIWIDERVYLGSKDTHKSFTLVPSKSKNHMLVVHTCPQLICFKSEETKQEKNTTIFYKMLDKDLKVIWDEELELPYPYKGFSLEKMSIDDNGKVYMMAVNYYNEVHLKIPGKFKYIIHVYDRSTMSFKDHVININNLFITDLGYTVDEKTNNIVIAGFYSSDRKFNVVGTVFAVIDQSKGSFVKRGFGPFSPMFVDHIALEQPDEDEIATVKYNLDQVKVRDDGGALIIAEGYSTREADFYNAATQTYHITHTFEYSNIVIASINPNGRLDWEQTITKRQVSENDNGYYSSYQCVDNDGKMNFFFNEAIKREQDVLQFYTVDKISGEMYAWLLFNAQEDALIIPKGGIKLDTGRLVMPSLRKGKFSFVDISF